MTDGGHDRHGFSIIELMVVVAIIGILVAVSAGGLVMARRAAIKTESVSDLRQIGLAWEMYTTANNERFTPGWVSVDAQRALKMHAAYPDQSPVPPSPSFGAGQPNAAASWVWRIVPYLDNDTTLIDPDPNRRKDPVQDWEDVGPVLSESPAYAYNGWYVGGHLHLPQGAPRPIVRFSQARMGDRRITNLVAQSRSGMRHPGRIAVFMPGRLMASPGIVDVDADNETPTFEVTPRYLADVEQWNTPTPESVQSLRTNVRVPCAVAGGQIPVHHADGHQSFYGITDLRDQSKWIDGARLIEDIRPEFFTHESD